MVAKPGQDKNKMNELVQRILFVVLALVIFRLGSYIPVPGINANVYFGVFYNKMFANYGNKTIYQFKPNRELMLKVRQAGKEGLIDAYKIGK